MRGLELHKQRPSINHSLRRRRLAVGIAESQVAEEVAWLIAAQTEVIRANAEQWLSLPDEGPNVPGAWS